MCLIEASFCFCSSRYLREENSRPGPFFSAEFALLPKAAPEGNLPPGAQSSWRTPFDIWGEEMEVAVRCSSL
jgi:hypothetical protein